LKTLEYPEISKEAPKEAPKESAPAPVAEKPTPAPAQPTATKVESGSDHHRKPKFIQYAPSVVHLLHNHHIKNPESIQATGPQGRLLKGDVLRHLGLIKGSPTPQAQPKKAEATQAQAQAQAQPSIGEYTDIPATNMRKVIARRLTESKSTVPHSYVAKDITMDNINALRSKLKNKHGIKVSVNDFIVRAVGLALRDVPSANVRFNPDTEDGIELIPEIDISIAVATPTGLITPIVKNADQQGLLSISSKVKDLANRAKINKLKPEEYQGGSFSISNLGMFDINNFTAIINPPQACILAVGSSRKVPLTTPYVDEEEVEFNNETLFSELLGAAPVTIASKPTEPVKSAPKDLLDELLETSASTSSKPAFETKTVMTVQLSIDERAVDSHAAAEFLNKLAFYLEDPELLAL
jgi:pyruvate dehydrogenase complex dihydrolipoamide acetyltransferase long form